MSLGDISTSGQTGLSMGSLAKLTVENSKLRKALQEIHTWLSTEQNGIKPCTCNSCMECHYRRVVEEALKEE